MAAPTVGDASTQTRRVPCLKARLAEWTLWIGDPFDWDKKFDQALAGPLAGGAGLRILKTFGRTGALFAPGRRAVRDLSDCPRRVRAPNEWARRAQGAMAIEMNGAPAGCRLTSEAER